MSNLKDTVRLQEEMICNLQTLVTNLEKDKSDLSEEVKRKEILVHEMKKKAPEECSYGCQKYNKSVEEIVTAGNKHREKLVAVKEIAEGQKDKIALLREQKFSLQHQVDKLVEDLEIEKKLVYTVQMESIKRIKRMKDELKIVTEEKKVVEVESIGNNDSLIMKIKELEIVAEKQEKEFKEKKSENEELERKIEFLKPRLESCLKDSQIVNARVQLLEKEKSNYSTEKYCELEEKLAGFELIVGERDSLVEKNRDLKDEILDKEQEIEVINIALDKATSEKTLHHSATSSLADELDIANNEFFECGPCDDKPQIVQGLESHIRSEHEGSSEKKFLETKLNEIKTKINEQKVKLTSTLFRLKEKESLEIETCNCKNFCQINHFKQNWRRSVSSDIFCKMKMVNNLSDDIDPPSYVSFATCILPPKFCSFNVPLDVPDLSEWIPAPNFVNRAGRVEALNILIKELNTEDSIQYVGLHLLGMKFFKSGTKQHKFDIREGAKQIWREKEVFRKLHFTPEMKAKVISYAVNCFTQNSKEKAVNVL